MPPKPPRMGGGGANLLDSQKTGDNSDFDSEEIDDKKTDNNDKNEDVDSSWTTPIYKGYEDYFVDFFNLPSESFTIENGVTTINYDSITRTTTSNGIELKYSGVLFDTITSDDLVGAGTLSEPYIVRSTKGFLYIFNFQFCKLYLIGKYIELDCDITLNDESFDENGTPSGGDGVIYHWRSKFADGTRAFLLDGNGYSASGMYFNDKLVDYVGLFGHQICRKIENLTVKNYYLKGKNSVATFGYSVEEIENCVAKNGFVYANALAAGITTNSKHIENTKNYSKVVVSDRVVGGFGASWASATTTIMKNCENYGQIEGIYYVGGLIGTPSAYFTVVDCTNYGTIKGKERVGGICSADYYIGAKRFVNCSNYGFIDATTNYAFSNAGILGWSTQRTEITNCTQNGVVKQGDGGSINSGLVGNINQNAEVVIRDCKVMLEGNVSNAIVGTISQAKVYIENVYVQYNTIITSANLFAHIYDCELYVSNIEANITFLPGSTNCMVFGDHVDTAHTTIKNILLKTNAKNATITKSNRKKINVKSAIVGKTYYGSDFSGYSVNWKTGELGVRSLSGGAFFQGKISKEWLEINGYQNRMF